VVKWATPIRSAQHARSFYQVVQDLFGEDNAVFVLTTRSVFSTDPRTYHR